VSVPQETERLRFRPMGDADVDKLSRIFLDPVAMRHYPSLIDGAGTLAWIRRTRSNYARRG